MGSEFMSDILEIDGVRFSLILPSLEKIDETTYWILMMDKDTKELYDGYLQHHKRFLKSIGCWKDSKKRADY